MTFSRKVFLSVFIATLGIGSALIWTTYSIVSSQTEERFVSRYSVFSKILAQTINRLDLNTETLMLNAAKVVVAKDSESGLLGTQQLTDLRDELNISHIFVTDEKGRFIRSTNEDPKLIPNLFSFCSDYKNLITGTSSVEATPVIQPMPEPKPYKFLSIPNKDRSRIIEVGVRVDFMAKTLTEALSEDENILSMSLYSPDGTPFGRFAANDVSFDEKKIKIPSDLNSTLESDGNYHFFAKIPSSHPQCCQCDNAGTSRNGEYYYVLEAEVSKRELAAAQATTKTTFILIAIGNLLLAFLFSRFLSRRLGKNIEVVVNKLRKIKEKSNNNEVTSIDGDDEMALLNEAFDKVLDDLSNYQDRISEVENLKEKVQLAKEVAHNIKSPIIAMEMVLPYLHRLPENTQKVIRNSVNEIKSMSTHLKAQSGVVNLSDKLKAGESEVLYLPIILDELVKQKQLEYSEVPNLKIKIQRLGHRNDAFVKGNAVELKCILSNLINNSVEAFDEEGGEIIVNWETSNDKCIITVSDNGVGIPEESLAELGKKRVTFKGGEDRGVGLLHAFRVIETWNGKISINSCVGNGTVIRIFLRKTPYINTNLRNNFMKETSF